MTIPGQFPVNQIYPSTKRTTGLPVSELVLWCGMFAPMGGLEGTTGLPVGLHFPCLSVQSMCQTSFFLLGLKKDLLTDSYTIVFHTLPLTTLRSCNSFPQPTRFPWVLSDTFQI